MEIPTYGEFLLERAAAMLAESVVVYSDGLRRILRRVGTPVSDSLLAIEGEDHEVASNYLDVTEDKEQIAFTPDKKAQALADQVRDGLRKFVGHWAVNPQNDAGARLLRALGLDPTEFDTIEPEYGETGKVISTHVHDYNYSVWAQVDFSGKRCVVRQADLVEPDDIYWQRNRQRVRVGRLVRAMLRAAGREFTDAQVEEFVNKYKAAWDLSRDAFRNFELVSGDDIAHWYWYGNYAPATGGTLHNSCMSRKPGSFFEIYTQNPDVCSLLVLKSEDHDGKITGRALVWRAEEGFTFMDRVYTNDESDVQLFRHYAHSRGWYHKGDNDSSENMVAVGPDGQGEHNVSVAIKRVKYKKFPYMDTLKYLDEGLTYYLSNDEGCSWDRRLESTTGDSRERCGTCGNSGRVVCGECEGHGTVDCGDCNATRRVECENCDGDGSLDCYTCDGSGEIGDDEGGQATKCPDCDGGKARCAECGGSGGVERCPCNGRGSVSCSDCGGDGEVDCPDCS
jgi:hypothetical protein